MGAPALYVVGVCLNRIGTVRCIEPPKRNQQPLSAFPDIKLYHPKPEPGIDAVIPAAGELPILADDQIDRLEATGNLITNEAPPGERSCPVDELDNTNEDDDGPTE